jgi:hypothetical protein
VLVGWSFDSHVVPSLKCPVNSPLWETENARYGTYRASYYRTWWMTKGVEPDDSYIPVRDEKEEIAAIIELIGIANEAFSPI